MEIIGTNQEEKNRKAKKMMVWITIAIIALFIISIILFITIYYLKEQLFKFNVDGVKTSVTTNDLFLYEGDTVYVSLRDIAPIIGYKHYNGGYKEYTEDNDKCYLEGQNEICIFEKDETTIYKTPAKEVDYEYFEIEVPIKRKNNKLYITSEGLSLACNLKFYYEPEENQITIYTLPYYADYYVKSNAYASVANNFKNQKALLYGLIVTQDVENTDTKNNTKNIHYGISTLDNKEIVGTKYTSIEFIESTQEFIVKTTENKVGIITSEGETKVQPQYDSLKQIDKDLNLYLATNNDKKGVIEKNGKILIYLEYDQIGINAEPFQTSNIKNPYLLYNHAIPVKQNEKWGMYDKKGNLILPIEYDGMGCIASDKTTNNILTIPAIKGIVVAKELETTEKKKVTYYGIVNWLGRELVPPWLETVYSTINNGREEYTMVNRGTSYNVIEYANQNITNLEELNDETKSSKNNETTDNKTTNSEVTTNEVTTNEITTNQIQTNATI